MSSKEKTDTWEPQSGLPDDFDFVITASYFGFRSEYQNGEVALLIWEGESPDEEIDSIIWPLGKGWEVVNEGASVQHPRRTRFIDASFVGRLINRVVKELGVDMRARGPATEAKVWVGLGFHMKREEVAFGEGILESKGGKTVHLMPISVLKGAKAAGKPRQTKPTAAAKEESSTDEAAAPTEEQKSALSTKLANLAKSLDKEKFQKAAMNLPGITDDGELLASVLDDSASGFWSKHHK